MTEEEEWGAASTPSEAPKEEIPELVEPTHELYDVHYGLEVIATERVKAIKNNSLHSDYTNGVKYLIQMAKFVLSQDLDQLPKNKNKNEFMGYLGYDTEKQLAVAGQFIAAALDTYAYAEYRHESEHHVVRKKYIANIINEAQRMANKAAGDPTKENLQVKAARKRVRLKQVLNDKAIFDEDIVTTIKEQVIIGVPKGTVLTQVGENLFIVEGVAGTDFENEGEVIRQPEWNYAEKYRYAMKAAEAAWFEGKLNSEEVRNERSYIRQTYIPLVRKEFDSIYRTIYNPNDNTFKILAEDIEVSMVDASRYARPQYVSAVDPYYAGDMATPPVNQMTAEERLTALQTYSAGPLIMQQSSGEILASGSLESSSVEQAIHNEIDRMFQETTISPVVSRFQEDSDRMREIMEQSIGIPSSNIDPIELTPPPDREEENISFVPNADGIVRVVTQHQRGTMPEVEQQTAQGILHQIRTMRAEDLAPRQLTREQLEQTLSDIAANEVREQQSDLQEGEPDANSGEGNSNVPLNERWPEDRRVNEPHYYEDRFDELPDPPGFREDSQDEQDSFDREAFF
jgi:hypothetical protein